MSETQGGFKTVLVHSLTSQMSELLSTTTVELGGEKGKHHISTLFILKLRLSTLGSCSFCPTLSLAALHLAILLMVYTT